MYNMKYYAGLRKYDVNYCLNKILPFSDNFSITTLIYFF